MLGTVGTAGRHQNCSLVGNKTTLNLDNIKKKPSDFV
jgi:hypothetical protein